MSVPVPSPAPHGYDYLAHKWTGRCPYGDVCSGCDALGYCTRAEPREEMNEPLTCPRCGSEEHGGDVSYDGCSDCRHPAAGSSVPDTSGQPETVEGGDVNVPRGEGGKPKRCAICHDTAGPFKPVRGIYGEGWLCDDIFACADRDRINAATVFTPEPLAATPVPASGLPAVREPDEGVNAAGERKSGSAASETCGPTTASPPAALTSVSVREPDEATILREAVSWAHWPVGKPQFHRSDMLAALDRLIADRDEANAREDAAVAHAVKVESDRDIARERHANALVRMLAERRAAESEVAVLTARLEACEDEVEQCIAQIKENDDDCDRIERALFGDCENRSADAMVEQADRLTARLTEAERALAPWLDRLDAFEKSGQEQHVHSASWSMHPMAVDMARAARAALAGERGDAQSRGRIGIPDTST